MHFFALSSAEAWHGVSAVCGNVTCLAPCFNLHPPAHRTMNHDSVRLSTWVGWQQPEGGKGVAVGVGTGGVMDGPTVLQATPLSRVLPNTEEGPSNHNSQSSRNSRNTRNASCFAYTPDALPWATTLVFLQPPFTPLDGCLYRSKPHRSS